MSILLMSTVIVVQSQALERITDSRAVTIETMIMWIIIIKRSYVMWKSIGCPHFYQGWR